MKHKDNITNGNKKKEYPEFVAYHFCNARGELMAMQEDGLNTEKFLQNGFSIDGSSVGMASVEKSDLVIVPDAESYKTISLDDDRFQHHCFLAHVVDEQGQPHPLDPRGILKKTVDKAHLMGYEPYFFSEVEFYIVHEEDGTPVDQAGYCSLPPQDRSYEFRQELGKICKSLGMQVKRIHHEVGPGQNEIELNLTPAMKNADDTLLCMWILEMLASFRHQQVIFSPKPFPNEAGSGLHQHILLRDHQTGENIFLNPELKGGNSSGEDLLSEQCQHAIAGLLRYADEITAVMAASEETFARLKPGFEAPIFKTWGFANRTTLVRVPKTSVALTRFEYRGGDLSGSVHLFSAVLLAALLKGIEDKLEIPLNADFNVEKLSPEELASHGISPVPLSFESAIQVLKQSEFLRESLGPEMVQFLIQRNQDLLDKE